MQVLAYALSILNASKGEIPNDFAGEWGEGVVEENYVIVSSHWALSIMEFEYIFERMEYKPTKSPTSTKKDKEVD